MSIKNIPVVIIHWGESAILDLAIAAAKAAGNFVILISDFTSPHLNAGADYCAHVNSFFESLSRFRDIYVHQSSLPLEFEYRCIVRWIILRDWMRSNGQSAVFHIDHDVLLFDRTENFPAIFSTADVGLSHRTCGHNSYITFEFLDQFVNFVQRTYSEQSGYIWRKIQTHWEYHLHMQVPGGVTDMLLLEIFTSGYDGIRLVEMTQLFPDSPNFSFPSCKFSTFDHNISVGDGYKTINLGGSFNVKQIAVHRENVPSGFLLKSSEYVRFLTLHFQGQSKAIAEDIVNFIKRGANR